MYNKFHILSVLLLVSLVASAQYSTERTNHYLALSLGGGEGNSFTSLRDDAPAFRDKAGADALFSIAYELRKGHFFFGLGAGIGYDYCWQQADSFTNAFARIDREGDAITYAYRYSDYRSGQHTLSVGIPVYFGGYIGDYLYLMAGAKLSISVLTDYRTTTMLSTDGTYSRFIHTIENAPTYGYFPAEEYAYRSQSTTPQLRIAPMVEIGSRLPVRSSKVEMRLGVYAEYHIPIGYTHNLPLVDYSHLSTTPPDEQTLQDMHSHLVFNPLTDSDLQQKAWSQLAVGIKWTCLFNLTRDSHPCRCLEM